MFCFSPLIAREARLMSEKLIGKSSGEVDLGGSGVCSIIVSSVSSSSIEPKDLNNGRHLGSLGKRCRSEEDPLIMISCDFRE